MEITVRLSREGDGEACERLAATVLDAGAARALVRRHLPAGLLAVAEAEGEIVGYLAWREDWFGCSLVEHVLVRETSRRRGVARALFRAAERLARGPRLFSSTEETNVPSIRMHAALGFVPSGHVDNLPQGVRELLLFRRVPPRGGPGPPTSRSGT